MLRLQRWIDTLVFNLDLGLLEQLDLSSLTNALRDLMGQALNLVTSTLPHCFPSPAQWYR